MLPTGQQRTMSSRTCTDTRLELIGKLCWLLASFGPSFSPFSGPPDVAYSCMASSFWTSTNRIWPALLALSAWAAVVVCINVCVPAVHLFSFFGQ
jgi:hypothetical protein